eukprot:gene13901-19829_t
MSPKRELGAAISNVKADKQRASPPSLLSYLRRAGKESAMGPIRELGASISNVKADKIRPISHNDFAKAMNVIKPSVNKEALLSYEEFTKEFGTS